MGFGFGGFRVSGFQGVEHAEAGKFFLALGERCAFSCQDHRGLIPPDIWFEVKRQLIIGGA